MAACLRCGHELSGSPARCACPDGPSLAPGTPPFDPEAVTDPGPEPALLPPEADPELARAHITSGDTGVAGPTSGDPDQLLPFGVMVGEYRIEGLLGEGAFGAIYQATHPVIGKRAAVKVLHRDIAAVQEMVQRFVDEARAVNQIRHKNIVDIFSFGTLQDGRHYCVMELLRGRTLAEEIVLKKRLGIEEALPILKDVARALAAAHAVGITHRDLKPENVFLVDDGEGGFTTKLLDFGIAKLRRDDSNAGPKTKTGTAMGTAAYMAPEQCRGRDVDPRTDVYSFGVLTYEVLTGRRPFDGESFVEVAYKHLHEHAIPPSVVIAGLPTVVDRTVAAMMQKDPDKRPADIGRAMAEFAAALGHPSTTGQRPAYIPAAEDDAAIAAMKRGKLPYVLAGAAAGALALALLLAFAWPRATPLPPPDVPAGPAIAGTTPVPPAPEVLAPVALNVRGTPLGAEVLGPDGVLLGRLPGVVALPRSESPVRLEIRAKGFLPQTREVVPSGDAELVVELAKRPKRPAADDIEEAF